MKLLWQNLNIYVAFFLITLTHCVYYHSSQHLIRVHKHNHNSTNTKQIINYDYTLHMSIIEKDDEDTH